MMGTELVGKAEEDRGSEDAFELDEGDEDWVGVGGDGSSSDLSKARNSASAISSRVGGGMPTLELD